MAAVAGFLIAATLAVAAALWTVSPRHQVRRDPSFRLADVAGRHVTVLGGLAGFAVAGLVFLVTQAKNVPDPSSTSFRTVLAMFVVAYMGYFSSSLLFANVSEPVDDAIFDLAAAQYAGASISLFSVFLGWFALVPLFETFGLETTADLVGWLLLGAVVVGYGQVGNALYRTGYGNIRLGVLLPLFAVTAVLIYAFAIAVFAPDMRSSAATLNLTIVAFVIGVPAYAVHTILPIAAHRAQLARVLADRWHLAVVAYAEATMVLIGFLLLSVVGLA
jgi:hypothetical protein